MKGRKTGGGSRKGIPNRATQDVRAAIALIAERNIANFEDWLARTAVDNPEKAAALFLAAIEYYIPKLARSEVTGKDGEPIRIEWPLPKHPLEQS